MSESGWGQNQLDCQTAPKAPREREAPPLMAWGPGASLRDPGGVQRQSPVGVYGAKHQEAGVFTKL